ncbi:TPA: hypothetical protein ACMDT9_002175 [Vibrio parahaemolyticus]
MMTLYDYKELVSGEDYLLDDGQSKNNFMSGRWSFQEYNIANETRSVFDINWAEEYADIPIYKDLKARFALLLYGEGKNDKIIKTEIRKKSNTIHSAKHCMQLVHHIIECWQTVPETVAILSHPLFFERVKEYLREKKYGQTSLEGHLTSYAILCEANDFLPEHLHVNFPIDGRNALAKELSHGDKGNHPTIIPELYGQILARLINLTEWYQKQLSSDSPSYGEMNSPSDPIAFKRAAIGLGYTTCMAFTGMRISEAVMLHRNSYLKVDFEGIETSLLNSSTVKLEQGALREDVWVCAEICDRAIEVIDLARHGDWEHCPSRKGNGKIKANKSNIQTVISEFKERHLRLEYKQDWDVTYRLLNGNVNEDPRKQLDDGTFYWHLNNHTWRRSFAHFAVGNDLASLGSLKQQLKHIYIGMTMIYTSTAEVLTLLNIQTDPTLIQEVDKSRDEYNRRYLSKVVNGESSGGFAESFMVDGEPRAISDEEFERLQKNSHTASRSTGFGRCFGDVRCSVSHVFQPSGCVESNCENFNISSDEAQRWKQLHEGCSKLISSMLSNNTINSNILARELSDLRAAEHVMRQHNIEFSEFVMAP